MRGERKYSREPLFHFSLDLTIFTRLFFSLCSYPPAILPASPDVQPLDFSFCMNNSKPKIHTALRLVIFTEQFFLEVGLYQHMETSTIFNDCIALASMDALLCTQSVPRDGHL